MTGLTINAQRSTVVDFTYPFWMEHSAAVMHVSVLQHPDWCNLSSDWSVNSFIEVVFENVFFSSSFRIFFLTENHI